MQEINSHCQDVIVILRSSYLPAAQVNLILEEIPLVPSARKLQSSVQASLDEFPQCTNEIDAIHILWLMENSTQQLPALLRSL